MSKNEYDYSDYITVIVNLSSIRAILAGFIFTAITLLFIELPDPSQIYAQIVLFTLTILFDMFLYTVYWEVMEVFRSMRKAPPWTICSVNKLTLHDAIVHSSLFLWGLTVALMFLVWNLIYLALITGAIWSLLMVLAYFHLYKPVVEYWKKQGSINN